MQVKWPVLIPDKQRLHHRFEKASLRSPKVEPDKHVLNISKFKPGEEGRKEGSIFTAREKARELSRKDPGKKLFVSAWYSAHSDHHGPPILCGRQL